MESPSGGARLGLRDGEKVGEEVKHLEGNDVAQGLSAARISNHNIDPAARRLASACILQFVESA